VQFIEEDNFEKELEGLGDESGKLVTKRDEPKVGMTS